MTNTTKQITEGSTSTGSCRTSDIIDGIRYLRGSDKPLSDLIAEYDDTTDEEEQIYILQDIFERLNEMAPEGLEFGSHPNDGADYGFWEYDQED